MINEQIVDAPEQQFFESRVVQVRVHVRYRGGHHNALDLLGQRAAADIRKRRFHRQQTLL